MTSPIQHLYYVVVRAGMVECNDWEQQVRGSGQYVDPTGRRETASNSEWERSEHAGGGEQRSERGLPPLSNSGRKLQMVCTPRREYKGQGPPTSQTWEG